MQDPTVSSVVRTRAQQARSFESWQRRIFVILWITYASFYLGRVNFSVALPGIMADFGWTRTDVGAIGTALFWAYAIGQFINGQLGDRLGARVMITVGLYLGSDEPVVWLQPGNGGDDRHLGDQRLRAVNGLVTDCQDVGELVPTPAAGKDVWPAGHLLYPGRRYFGGPGWVHRCPVWLAGNILCSLSFAAAIGRALVSQSQELA